MLQTLLSLDESLFLFLNNIYHSSVDGLMIFISQNYAWLPLYAFIIYLIIRKFKIQTIYIIVAIVLLITLSDRFTSGFMKPYFHRLRPCHEIHLRDKIHVPGGCGGQYGFVSSHAANSFATAMFIFLLFGRNKRGGWFLFSWAFLVSYSRIYLGVHYPGDVLAGALVGMFFAVFIYYLLSLVPGFSVKKL